MKIFASRKAALGMTAALLMAAPGLALAAGEALKGMIVSHEGSTIVVRSGGSDTTVQITPSTKIRSTGGFLGMETNEQSESDLLRGLAVQVETAGEGGQLAATQISFKSSDFKTAQQISAGIVATETRVATNAGGIAANAGGIAANSGRIDNVGVYEAAGRTKVFFAVGSSAIDEKGKHDLQALAAQAKAIKGARLVVVARADTTGNSDANERLSENRAAAVSDYLLKSCGVLPTAMMPLTALGSSEIAFDPDPPATLDEARRATVTIVVSKSATAPAS